MKKYLLILLLIVISFSLIPVGVSADPGEDWIVVFPADASQNDVAVLADQYDLIPILYPYYRCGETAARALADQPGVASVFPAGVAQLCERTTYKPVYDDPESAEQWGLAAVNIENCWKYYTTGSSRVTVCVIDSGFYYGHEDAGSQFIAGRDYVDGGINNHDDSSHGTSCAGLLGATTDNGIGITGLCKNVRIVNQRAFYYDTEEEKNLSDAGRVAQAICDAVNIYHADVISMSFLFLENQLMNPENFDMMEAACEYAASKGAILVAAAGNYGTTTNDICYPAAYDCVIGVGALAKQGSSVVPANFSVHNKGVFCCAPGANIMTLGNPESKENELLDEDKKIGLYRYTGGTSLATPFVAGLAVMAKSLDPAMTNSKFMALLIDTCTDLGEEGYDYYYGNGLINYEKTVKKIYDEKHGNVFVDVSKSNWFYNAVTEVYKRNLMSGVSKTRFAPNMKLDRAMFVTILYRMAGSPATEGENPFVDVEAGSWYDAATNWGQEKGIVSGLGEGRFGPNVSITREQIAAILGRYAEAYNIVLPTDQGEADFSDADKISDWAKEPVEALVKAGIINGMGDGTFAPRNTATRAQAAQLINSLCKVIEGH